MKDQLLHTPEGVRDIHLSEAAKKNDMQGRVMSIFHSYGFKDVQTPTFEYIDVFNNERGTVDTKMMYKFFDRNGSTLALRPDITPSIARFVATSFEKDNLPKRICYLGNTFRNNESYQGKLREFTQAGVELIGLDNSDADAEVIAVIVNSLLACGLKEFQIDLGQAGFFQGLVEEAGLTIDQAEELRSLIDEKNYIAIENLIDQLEMEPQHKDVLLNLPKLFGSVEVIEKAKSLTTNAKALASLSRLEAVYEILCDYGIEEYISVDLGMVSQLYYYTGIVFKAFTYESGVSIVDGGRYDNLLAQFGTDAPAVGFAIIVDELLSALERQNIALADVKVDTLLLYTPQARRVAIGIAEGMRAQEMNIETGLLEADVETNIAYGKKYGIGGILNFLNDDDVELINLKTGKRETVKVSTMFEDPNSYESEPAYYGEQSQR